jgi:energy-coupling factor transport system ATP-binding protein
MLVLGPSGSGKSSLLHLVTGVIPFSHNVSATGTVSLLGEDVTARPVVERSRHLGVVSQDPTAAVCLARVDQEVALPLENHGVEPSAISARVDRALDLVGALALRARATSELSGGELQRVALSAALAVNPEVLLLDEPTSMLDPAGVRAVRESIDTVVDHARAAVVIVEHRLDEFAGRAGLRRLPERVVALGDDGRIVADGPTEKVLTENAAALHDAGCWLPLESELLAVSGHAGGLASEQVRDWLLASAGDPLGDSERHRSPNLARRPGGEPLLRARSVTVGRAAPGRSAVRRGVQVTPIIRGVDLELRAGEVVALLGANGSGKTSLLLTLAGLLPPRTGTIAGPRPSMVFQYPELQFLAHRVRDEIAAGLTGPSDRVREIVERQLAAHRLEHVADANPHRLSGGEKRRLSLAAMLAHTDRPVLLADEPTYGLDRRDTVSTAAALRTVAEEGRAVAFSSHDLRFVTAVADRVVVIADGSVVADGPTVSVLGNGIVLERAGLELPLIVSWLLQRNDLPGGVARTLRRLYSAPASRVSSAGPAHLDAEVPG